MSDTSVNYIINISGNATANLQNIAGNASAATVKIGGLRSSLSRLGESMFALNQISDAFGRISQAIDQAIQPGIEYDTQLTELSAIAGVTGDKLKEIGGYARDNAKIFGGSAGKSVESYKLLLSQLGPAIAQSPEALQAMGKSVSVLSKTLGNDPAAATEVLTAAMNQYQVSLDDPMQASAKMAEMMNIMSAAAKAGSAELPAIADALQNSGMAAKMAGVSFAETNAAIQVLDKAGKKGAEGGVALRNVMCCELLLICSLNTFATAARRLGLPLQCETGEKSGCRKPRKAAPRRRATATTRNAQQPRQKWRNLYRPAPDDQQSETGCEGENRKRIPKIEFSN
ncbi:MAG TPA: phage tail tape measure protein [Bacteroidales bacterium]|nr:phage tail tape measure protein [Bacteroidales bacterium]